MLSAIRERDSRPQYLLRPRETTIRDDDDDDDNHRSTRRDAEAKLLRRMRRFAMTNASLAQTMYPGGCIYYYTTSSQKLPNYKTHSVNRRAERAVGSLFGARKNIACRGEKYETPPTLLKQREFRVQSISGHKMFVVCDGQTVIAAIFGADQQVKRGKGISGRKIETEKERGAKKRGRGREREIERQLLS